jgi:hypothetical protein
METMHAAGRRNLPPVPRPHVESDRNTSAAERPSAPDRRAEPVAETADDFDTTTFDPVEIDLDDDGDLTADDGDLTEDDAAPAADTAPEPETVPAADSAPEPEPAPTPAAELEHRTAMVDADDPAQHFVSRLRAAAADFAAAAGAESAVVREAVPPARHRRSRCRLVLRYAGGDEADLTFLGSVGRPGTPAWSDFDRQIQQWLGTGQHREAAWLVEDLEAPDGVAVDVPAWLAAG